jgi:hypothetical protein
MKSLETVLCRFGFALVLECLFPQVFWLKRLFLPT